MNKHLLKLEFDKIIDSLLSFAIIDNTKSLIKKIEPYNDIDELNSALDEVDEALKIICRYGKAPIYFSSDISNIPSFVKKGGILDGLEIYNVGRFYKTIKENKDYLLKLHKENIDCKYYQEIVDSMFLNELLLHNIERSVDETGYVLDDASMNLKSIRNRLSKIEIRIKNKLQEIIAKESKKLSLQTVTMRDGHFVIPVKSEYKNSIKGAILDISGTEQTVYIEPNEIIEIQSLKNDLLNQEKQEIEKILRFLTLDIAEYIDLMIDDLKKIIHIDFVFAKADLAKKQNANRVQINNQHILNLINAYHPLLNVKKVIPNTIQFENNLGIIITGPNTGGKTVLLKTVGLLCTMTKYGLLIPADSKSNVMIFDMICCDIGDEQSIIENLSTFSGHMNNIVDIIASITPNSLILFDEIGGGTDPSEGVSLAIAILDYLIENNIKFIVTTHYSELKLYAYNKKLVENASMEFNSETLNPTYHLRVGIPGSSNALLIAKRLGLKEEIIQNAEKNDRNNNDEIKNTIIKLEEKYQEYDIKCKDLDDLIKLNEEKDIELSKRLKNIENEKDKIINKAYSKALEDIEKIKEEANALLNDLKQQNNSNLKLHELIEYQNQLKNIDVDAPNKEKNKKEERVIYTDYKVGDDVYVEKYDQYGYIVKINKNNKYDVSIGNMVITLSNKELDKRTNDKKDKGYSNVTVVGASRQISLSLDLRGMRYDEAKDAIDKYFDDVLLNNIKQFTIIHGYGTGTMRNLVNDYLKNNKYVDSYRYGVQGEGGLGVTVVNLK